MSTPLKRGSTWRVSGVLRDSNGALVDLTGWAIASKLRTPMGVEVASLTCTVDPDQVAHRGEFEVYASDVATSTWPLGPARWDIRLEDAGGDVSHTKTVPVVIEEAITR